MELVTFRLIPGLSAGTFVCTNIQALIGVHVIWACKESVSHKMNSSKWCQMM